MSCCRPSHVDQISIAARSDRIPDDWTFKRLRFVASFTNSNVDKKSYEGQASIKLCNYTDIYYNSIITDSITFMDATASEAEIEAFSLKKGDVIITKDSEDPSDIGIPSLVMEDMPGVVCGYHLTIIRSPDFQTARILHRVLMSNRTKAHFFVEAPGITRYGLGQDAIGNIPVCLPPPEARKNIADIIDRETARIDKLITKKTLFVELLKEKRQALIANTITNGLDPAVKLRKSNKEWIGDVPQHWQVAPIKYVARLESGHTPSRSVPAYWENCTVPWFTLADIWQVRKEHRTIITETAEKVSELGLANSSARKLPEGTVVLSRTASVGFPAILGCEMATSQDFAAWICSKRLDNQFLYLCLIAMKTELDRLMMGSTHKTIYMPDIEGFRIPLPPVNEQRAIVDYIGHHQTRIDQLVAKTQRSIDLLKERRSAFITAAVTGQIDLWNAS